MKLYYNLQNMLYFFTIVRTNYLAFKYLQNFQKPFCHFVGLIEQMGEYNFEIVYSFRKTR